MTLNNEFLGFKSAFSYCSTLNFHNIGNNEYFLNPKEANGSLFSLVLFALFEMLS